MTEPESFIPRENPNRNKLVTLVCGLTLLSGLAYYEWSDHKHKTEAPTEQALPAPVTITTVDSVFAEHRKTDPTYPLPSFIAEQMPLGSDNAIKTDLMQRAVTAVENEDRHALASAQRFNQFSGLSQ